MCIPIAIAILLGTSAALAQPVPTEGLRVVDGDTLSVGGHRIACFGSPYILRTVSHCF
jgi:hypothetical protein